MKYSILATLLIAALFISCDNLKKGNNADLKTRNDSLSYALGISVGGSLQEGDIPEFNYEIFVKAMKDFRDSTEAMDQEEARNFIIDEMTFQAKKKGSDFLEANKTKQGINVTPSGLQYEVLTEGTGMVPDADDSVTVHYSGTLIDGKVFDSSIERGEPVTFILSQVIPGWSEGLQLMHEGSKYKLYIPQELGYGARPPGGIPPYSPLIFEVELIRVKKNDGVAGEPGLGEIEHK